MPSPSSVSVKASDKQKACKKLLTLLHKDYGRAVPKFSLPVLETMLFAVCLEDNPWQSAQEGYERLHREYFDLNEVRVSSVAEIEETLSDLRDADWKGLRIRSILRFVFETTYSFDYEKLRRLTQESAQKRLKKIDHLSPFVRHFTVQQCLAGYLVPMDRLSTQAAVHLGLVPPDSTEEQAGDFLKGGLRKAETFPFLCALRALATDPRYVDRLSEPPDEDEPFDISRVEERFAALKKPKKRRKKKAAAASTSGRKSAAGISSKSRRTTAAAKKKTAKESATKKTTHKKTAASGTARPAASKKAAAKKTAVKKTTTKKTTAKKTSAASAKKSAAKKTAKTATRKTAAKKKAAKKTAAGRSATATTSAGKTAKKSAARKTTVSKKKTAAAGKTTGKKKTAAKTAARKKTGGGKSAKRR